MTFKEGWNAFFKHPVVKGVKKTLGILLRCIVTILLVCVITVSIVGCVVAVYVVTNFDGSEGLPDLKAISNNESSFIYVQNDKGEWEIDRAIQGANQVWTDLEEIPIHMRHAVIAIEDERFDEHDGVDWRRTVSAFVNLIFRFSDTEYGGSTITQQLIKVVTGNNDHSIPRKITEIMQAIELEKNAATKDDVIEAYLNVLPLSGDIKGVGAAAHAYFAKDIRELSIAECALIAGITQNPSRYNPYTHPQNARERQRLVLYKMHELGHITDDEYIQALGEELVFQQLSGTGTVQNYYTDMVIEDVIQGLMTTYGYNYAYAEQLVFYGGLQIYSMEDSDIQETVENIYANEKNFPEIRESDDGDDPHGAIFIMDYNGRVVATAGQRGEKKANRIANFATQYTRQCGSAIKPLSVYSLAVENNLVNYSSMVRDCYIMLGNNKWPSNSGSKPKDNGNVLLEMAIQRSLNTVPVRLLQSIGVERSFDFMTTSLCVNSLHKTLVSEGQVLTDMDLAPLALGGLSKGVTVREMTAAYQIFGNGGEYVAPYSYMKVMRGEEVLLNQPEKRIKAISEDTAYIMNRLLQHVIRGEKGTGRDIAKDWEKWEVFAKTGTTSDNYDSYFVGGTTRYVAASWFGYKYNKSLTNTQKKYSRYLWNDVMRAIHKGETDAGFAMPETVVEATYCKETGLLAAEHCTKTAIGVYKQNFMPTVCAGHDTKPTTKPATTTTEASTSASSNVTTDISDTTENSTATLASTDASPASAVTE